VLRIAEVFVTVLVLDRLVTTFFPQQQRLNNGMFGAPSWKEALCYVLHNK
jgi:hypothetical protein